MSEKESSSTLHLSEEGRRTLVRLPRHGASLVIYHRSGVMAVPLLGVEPVVVGRAPPADIVIDDPSLSRRHASFTRRGGAVWIEDLGSTNGTRLRGDCLREPSPLAPGDELVLGSVLVALHGQRGATDVSTLLAHDALVSLLDLELQRAKHYARSLSAVMVRAEAVHYGRWVDRMRSVLRPFDSVAIYSPEAVEVLLPESGSDEAMDIAAAIIGQAQDGVALRAGVATYPVAATTTDQVLEACRRALHHATAKQPVVLADEDGSRITRPGPDRDTRGPIIESASMRKLFATVDRVARSAIPVLLTGETGTGKEVVTRALVERGPRSGQPLVCVNCGAIPSQLVESTLFGHDKGAFTGASKDNPGVFSSASGGTVLLDEVGELPAAAQAALLRVLEAKVVTRVGSSQEIPVDVRVIAATHRDLEAMVDRGAFRRDLLYRLNAVVLDVPPLRERIDEIPALVERFLREANHECGAAIRGMDADALELVRSYSWPGNLRELRNAIDRAVVIAQGDTIGIDDLPQRVRGATRSAPGAMAASEPAEDGDEDLAYAARIKRYEVNLIIEALRGTEGNQTEAAKQLRMPLRTLVHKLKTLGIKRSGFVVDQ